MSISETRSQDDIAITIAGDDAEVIDGTPGWKGPFTEYDRYDRPTGYNYAWCLMCEAEVLGGKASTASHRPACCYE